ncbi:hypothetical protein [Floccifex sp.]|uniref:hypothetical protein n=1 Tax=Floccifex sp. TaxID=2815810 RepID=UPI003EFF8064
MDYKTKPLTRDKIRMLAPYFRELFDVPLTGPFPVLEALEKLPDVFENSNYEVVEDDELDPKVMAQCSPNDNGGFTIKIKESIYEGAYENGTGAFLGFINHEICHVFLFEIGFKPIYERSFENNIIPAYKSVEWQAKALDGEVMIPYDECKNMPDYEIEEKYHVSKSFVKYFKKHIVKGSDAYEGKEKTH